MAGLNYSANILGKLLWVSLMEKHALFARISALADLTDGDRAAIAALDMARRKVARRTIVLPAGTRPDFVYVILSGWAARYEVRRDGGRRITGFLLPGDFCGIHAVCRAAMDHSIVALTDCEIGIIDAAAMGDVVRRSSAIFDAIWRSKLVEEAILRKWLVYNADAKRAVAHLLCELHARADAVGLCENGSCPFPVIQEEIGDAMGITAVHTNRVLQRLRADDLIDLHDQTLRIKNGAALRRVAEFDPGYLEPWLTDNARASAAS